MLMLENGTPSDLLREAIDSVDRALAANAELLELSRQILVPAQEIRMQHPREA